MNDADKPEYSRYDKRDEWDEWNDRRNADMNAYAGRRYLPDTVYIGATICIGTAAGSMWRAMGSPGCLTASGVSWAPYSVGRWCYRPFYGWTWVSYEPWGWLPYHYGRWYRSSMLWMVLAAGAVFRLQLLVSGAGYFLQRTRLDFMVPAGSRRLLQRQPLPLQPGDLRPPVGSIARIAYAGAGKSLPSRRPGCFQDSGYRSI